MDRIDVLAVVGTCAPERSRHALGLADATGRGLIPARRLGVGPDALEEAIALAPWAGGMVGAAAGAVIEFPSHLPPTAIIGALTDEDDLVLSDLVCVVDASHLLRDLHENALVPRLRFAHDGPPVVDHLALAMLTVAQIEYASMIVLVNWEPLETADLSLVLALVSSLSPHARLTLDGSVPGRLEPGAPYAREQERPGWIAVLNGEHDPHMTDPRVSALRYENVRPLHPGRLRALLDERLEPDGFGRVIRSAGFCRFATRPGIVAEWDHVGRMICFEPLAVDPGPGDPDADDVTDTDADHDPLSLGQDLAIIGIDLDGDALTAALDAAALNDEELAAGPAAWQAYADPFPRWLTAVDHSE